MGFFAVNVTVSFAAPQPEHLWQSPEQALSRIRRLLRQAGRDQEHQRRAVVIGFLHPDELFHAVTPLPLPIRNTGPLPRRLP